MKYSEFQRRVQQAGWKFKYARGSHYFYEKDGRVSPPIPYHGSKEVSNEFVKMVGKQLGEKLI